jgi:hypothetical protein
MLDEVLRCAIATGTYQRADGFMQQGVNFNAYDEDRYCTPLSYAILAMEYYPGKSLFDVLIRIDDVARKFTLQEMFSLMLSMLDEVKALNFEAKLIDFGLARENNTVYCARSVAPLKELAWIQHAKVIGISMLMGNDRLSHKCLCARRC